MISFLSILFPERCNGCNAEGTNICAACAAHCAPHWTRPPRAPWAKSMLRYDDAVVQKLLYAWKYRGDTRVELVLLKEFRRGLVMIPRPRNACVVPIPTQRKNNNLRNFSPPLHLAQTVADVWNIPLCSVLTFARKTQRQAALPLAKRRENMHNAFVVHRQIPAHIRSVILVDDVVTSGATLAAARTAFTDNGISNIQAITLVWNP